MDVGWDIFRGICTRENFSPSISGTSSFGLISHSVLVKKERKNNLKTLNHAWEYLIWWQFVAVRSMSCYCCRFAPLHIYIYIYEIKQEPLIYSLFLIIYLSHPRHVDLIMKIECFFLSTTDSLYSHWIFFVLKWSGKGFVLQKFCTVNCNLKFFL